MGLAEAGRSLVEVAESVIYYKVEGLGDAWWCNYCHHRLDVGHAKGCKLEALDVACQVWRSAEEQEELARQAAPAKDDDARALASVPESIQAAIRGALAEEREWVRGEIALALGAVPARQETWPGRARMVKAGEAMANTIASQAWQDNGDGIARCLGCGVQKSDGFHLNGCQNWRLLMDMHEWRAAVTDVHHGRSSADDRDARDARWVNAVVESESLLVQTRAVMDAGDERRHSSGDARCHHPSSDGEGLPAMMDDAAFRAAWDESLEATRRALDDRTREYEKLKAEAEAMLAREKARYDADLLERQRIRQEQLAELQANLHLMQEQKRIIDEETDSHG